MMKFSKERFENYINQWLGGLDSEIKFWDWYMSEGRKVYKERWDITVSPTRPFVIEEDLYRLDITKEIKFLDVGSGPFSRCGRVCTKYNVDINCVDPLGNIYGLLKEKHELDNGTKVIQGFVEFLDKQFAPNTFDCVHMSNSLDHCFDPVYGLLQLLSICKIGGDSYIKTFRK